MVKTYWPESGENNQNENETSESTGLLFDHGRWFSLEQEMIRRSGDGI